MGSRLTNFGWVRLGQVAGMGLPPLDAREALRAEGITAIVTLTERPLPPEITDGLVALHEPVVDFAPPTQEQLLTCVRFIDAQRAAGGAVAVHCMAGIGRTGTVLAAWLVAQGMPPAAALIEVRRLRPGSVETRAQMGAIAAFAETWADASAEGTTDAGRPPDGSAGETTTDG